MTMPDLTIRIHPTEPYADGILFDDLHGMSDEARNRLAGRGVVYCTEFKTGGKTYAGNIVAASLAQAQLIAFSRGLGEVVDGKLVETGEL